MARLPERPNSEDLEKQAHDLFRQSREKDPAASLEDAQSSIARDYGVPNWGALQNNVDWRNTRFSTAREHAVPYWLHAVYGHQKDPPKPNVAAQTLAENPGLVQNDLFLACATGDEVVIRAVIAADPACVNRTPEGWRCPGCKKMIAMPPLVAVTHSTLLRLSEYCDRLRNCVRILLDAGANPNQSYMEGDHPLSALYGAFLDAEKIKRATLVGYSLAGNELTEFAALYPKRIIKLVYLDAAYDLPENMDLGRKAGLDLKLPEADFAMQALIDRSNEYHPDYRRIQASSLGFFVTYDEAPKSPLWDEATQAKLLAYWNDYGKAYRREQIERFQKEMKKQRVIELHHTTHGRFIFEEEQQSILIREMLAFLVDAAR